MDRELPDTRFRQSRIYHQDSGDPSFDQILSYLARIPLLRQPDQRTLQQPPDNKRTRIPRPGQRNGSRRRPTTNKPKYQNKNQWEPETESHRGRIAKDRLKAALCNRQHCPKLVVLLCHRLMIIRLIQLPGRRAASSLSCLPSTSLSLSSDTFDNHLLPVHLSLTLR